MEALSTAQDLSNTVTCCEPCLKNIRFRKVILIITFILATFDLITDWINWKQWSEVGGHAQHRYAYLFKTAFLFVVEVGKVLWIIEIAIIVVKFSGMNRGGAAIPSDASENSKKDFLRTENKPDGNMKNMKREKCAYRLGVVVLILTGFLEDFPVLVLMYFTANIPICGAPARREIGSDLTMATIISSMLNSLWTMVFLIFETCGGQKICAKYFQCCRETKNKSDVRGVKRNRDCRRRCKENVLICGNILLCPFILLLFASNLLLGLATIDSIKNIDPFPYRGRMRGFETYNLINDSTSDDLKPVSEHSEFKYQSFLQQHVVADRLGPGLDGKPDEAMFIYLEMKLPSPHQVVLYDDKDNVIARSAWTEQIINRLYIGQFEELSNLKGGTLRKAVPCSRVFPFLGIIDETIFTWEGSLPPRSTHFSDCKLIFTFRYYTSNNDWNPFKEIHHRVDTDITIKLDRSRQYDDSKTYMIIESGIHIHNESICPLRMRPLRINEVLTKEVETDIIDYTCSSACGDDANICDKAHHSKFTRWQGSNDSNNLLEETDFFLAINDLKVADTYFTTHFFEHSEFCNKTSAEVETVEVPIEIQQNYPQFITIPELYRSLDNTVVPRNICNKMWDSKIVCCRRQVTW